MTDERFILIGNKSKESSFQDIAVRINTFYSPLLFSVKTSSIARLTVKL